MMNLIVFVVSVAGGALGTSAVFWLRDYKAKKKIVKRRSHKTVSAIIKANGHAHVGEQK